MEIKIHCFSIFLLPFFFQEKTENVLNGGKTSHVAINIPAAVYPFLERKTMEV